MKTATLHSGAVRATRGGLRYRQLDRYGWNIIACLKLPHIFMPASAITSLYNVKLNQQLVGNENKNLS